MPGFARAALALTLLATLIGPAHAFGGRRGYTASYSYPVYYPTYYPAYYSVPAVATVSYYAPAWQVYAAPAPVVCAPGIAVPVTVPAGPLYAVPSAAPPSQTVEPPPARTGAGPVVSEARTGTVLKTVAAGNSGRDRVQVGFWNVSGRDLTLTIDGQQHILPRNRSITLDLGRQFTWRIDRRAAQDENIPEGNATLEIVLRR
jgi:hypothetical protein